MFDPLMCRCSQIYLAISSSCRHKGALEAANLTCGSFCSMLLDGRSPASHQSLPLSMLHSVLSMLTSSWSCSSFTRRSAGLPGLVTRLVAAEPKDKPRVLLPTALTTLLQYCKEPSHKDGGEIIISDSTSSHGTQAGLPLRFLFRKKWL